MKHGFDLAALQAHAKKAPAGVMEMPRADASAVSAQLSEVSAQVKALREDVLPKAESALKEAEKGAALSAEAKASIDKLMAQFNEANAKQSKLEGALEALESRNVDLEQQVAAGLSGFGGGNVKSLGAKIAESDEMASYVAAGLNGSMKLDVSAAITTADGSGGGVNWSEREETPVNMPRRILRIRNLLNVVTTQAGVIDYAKQTTRTHGAAPVAEGGTSQESSYGWTKANAIVKKIAHHTHASDEALADAGQLQGLIDGELRDGLDLKEEGQILAGDGTDENLSGLITEATAFSAQAGLPNTDRLERLRLAMLQVVLNDYNADAMVLSPVDWAAIELYRETATGQFIIGGPDAPAGPTLWRLPVVESNSMAAGTWLVGAMRMAATLYDRMTTEVLISSEHGTNFVDGMKTMKATKRLALAVKRPASLVKGNFTFA